MQRFPDDFREALSTRGREVLAGHAAECGSLSRVQFFVGGGLLDAGLCAAAPELLATAFTDQLVPVVRELPPNDAATVAHGDCLPKTARMLSTPMGGDESSPVFHRATACGLAAMLRSPAYHDFVEALSGRKLTGPVTMQVLCYRPGDYAGPHTDHHPAHEATRGGYTDVHLTFCSAGVQQQLLVYEQQRHFSQVVDIAGTGTVTAYRLPFWHYTTPMVGTAAARRWLVLGSFLHA